MRGGGPSMLDGLDDGDLQITAQDTILGHRRCEVKVDAGLLEALGASRNAIAMGLRDRLASAEGSTASRDLFPAEERLLRELRPSCLPPDTGPRYDVTREWPDAVFVVRGDGKTAVIPRDIWEGERSRLTDEEWWSEPVNWAGARRRLKPAIPRRADRQGSSTPENPA